MKKTRKVVNLMRDRLIELINDMQDKGDVGAKNENEISCHVSNKNTADYLLENGVIVPPCKVGQTVYCVYHKKVVQGIVRLIRPFISEKETVFKGNVVCEVDNLFLDDGSKEEIELYVVFEKPYGIEVIAYLTKEEAEQALKGGAKR